MATGGQESDISSDLLDVSELKSELAEFESATDLETSESSVEWEEWKAQQEFEELESGSCKEPDFLGFTPPSQKHLAKPKSESQVTRSAPTSPASVRAHTRGTSLKSHSLLSLKVKDRIRSWESLTQNQQGNKKHPLPKKAITRSSLKKGLTSPLVPAGNFARKRPRKQKPKITAINPPQVTVTMAQVDIQRAGRLNPRNRGAGGAGDTLDSLGFPQLSQDGIPTACRLHLRRFILHREEMATDANLVLTDANITSGKSVAEGYLTRIEKCREGIEKVLETVDVLNANTEAAITEIYKVESELRNIIGFCELKMANGSAGAAAAAAVDQVRLARLEFPNFDGTGNYRTWKANFTPLANLVSDDQTKKCHVLKALQGNAKRYIESTMVPSSTYADIISMLENRYNDPMAVNYHLLNRVFNSQDLSLPQSTQAHWDSAVGDIRAILESGMGVGELLVFYRLHKFPSDIVRRVKDLHKIKYPGKSSISLDEAMDIMNKITAEEAELTQDTVAVEQCIQNLTLTATPKVTQVPNQVIQSKSPPRAQAFPTRSSQYNTSNKANKGKISNSTNAQYHQQTTQAQQQCQVCGNEEHNAGLCDKFTNAEDRRAELMRQRRCYKCAAEYSSNHQCNPNIWCKHCEGFHRSWLCVKTEKY